MLPPVPTPSQPFAHRRNDGIEGVVTVARCMHAKVFVRWYLDVHVEDSISQDVPLATVTASYPNGTQAESDLTDENGRIRLTLIEKMVNVTGEFPIGNYTVKANYDIYQDQATMNMTGNQETTLKLGFVIPELPSLIILPLFMTLTLLATMVFKKYSRRKVSSF